VAKLQVIQQWQYLGATQPELLDSNVMQAMREAGVDAIQSYVTWAQLEPTPGNYDFSCYDELLELAHKNNLQWVPFLIAGPHYATPPWFQESEASLYARCMEHDEDSKIQSIWNPKLRAPVANLLKAFAEHYAHHPALASVLLGISGNWGESIFPDWGCFYGGFHTHAGWWCADGNARADFASYLSKKYDSIDCLNQNWNSDHKRWEDAFPDMNFESTHPSGTMGSLVNRIYEKLPQGLQPLAQDMHRFLIDRRCEKIQKRWHDRGSIEGTGRALLDLANWYCGAMSCWAEFWLSNLREHLPGTDIYLVTGATGLPSSGADFSAQARLAARYGAGLRITNHNDSYALSFPKSRLVASACRFYDGYFSTEEAGVNTSSGVPMRLFDAISTGARGVYFKCLIGLGKDHCSYVENATGTLTEATRVLQEHRDLLVQGEPSPPVAILYPSRAITLDAGIQQLIFQFSTSIRHLCDFDYVDETMLADGALENYAVALRLGGDANASEQATIKQWLESGGTLLTTKDKQANWMAGAKPTQGGVIWLPDSGRALKKSVQRELARLLATSNASSNIVRSSLEGGNLELDQRRNILRRCSEAIS